MDNIEKAHETRDLNISGASRGVWLVKVPKYLSEQWQSSEGNVGKLHISKPKTPGGKSDVVFKSRPLPQKAGESTLPQDHKFVLTGITGHSITVLSETPNPDHATKGGPYADVSVDGRVIQRAECQPLMRDKNYITLKRLQKDLSNEPKRKVKQLEGVVQTYKPVAAHAADLLAAKQKKETVKRSRQDKDVVMDVLFGAFEKHQYYNIKDLEKITKQPMPYLKEILKEICTYNMKAPHRNMWELKSEFRHYKEKNDT